MYFFSPFRFSVEFRIYILENCRFDFCEILAHRLSLKFLSPILLLNRQGIKYCLCRKFSNCNIMMATFHYDYNFISSIVMGRRAIKNQFHAVI